jgi:murein biosynthesis integral membrane protein MurJ
MIYGNAGNAIIPKALWILYFCYATLIALVFQKLLLPIVPSLHAGHGLLSNDAIYFHTAAIDLANQIRESGWSNWSLWPGVGAGANVAVLSILYVFFEPDPSLLIPINAILHASSGVLIYLIAIKICPGKVGNYAGLLVSVLFVVFPSSLNWYAQIHKDGYAILGYLLVLYSWVSFDDMKYKIFPLLVGNIAGAFFVMSVRPYAVDILFLAVLGLFVCVVLSVIIKKRRAVIIVGAAGALLCIGAFSVVIHKSDLGSIEIDTVGDYYLIDIDTVGGHGLIDHEKCPIVKSWQWQHSNLVPIKLDYYAQAVSKVRLSSVCGGYGSNSEMDGNIIPEDILGVIAYLPRSFQIAWFAPFPDTWFHDISITRLVGSAEMFIWYLLMPGVIMLLLRHNTLQVWLVLSFGFVFLLTYGYVTANLGTLHRVRYPFIMLYMLLGVLGWFGLLSKNLNLKIFDKKMGLSGLVRRDSFEPERVKVIYAGVSVVGFTALSFILLFFRDVLMGQKFGVGNELDAFFLAMLLPMFMVNVFSIPLGSALIPVYHKLLGETGKHADSMLSIVLFISLSSLILGGGVLLITAQIIYPVIVSDLESSAIIRTLDLLPYGVAILVLSVVVVIGNAVLNARQIYSLPAIFQVAVPACAIISLYIFGKESGIASVVIGMLVGQIINLALVLYILYRAGVMTNLRLPNVLHMESYRELSKLYLALVVAALFMNAATVIDNIMASSLGAGNIGIYSLGSKVNIFVTGIIGAGLASVVLPRFSRLFTQGDMETCRQDLAFFIYLGTALAIPAGLILFSYSDDAVRKVFSGEMMSLEGAGEVGRVTIFGVIQLPFFVCHSLLIRFANANQKSKIVVVAATIGLILNIVLNIILIKVIGVAGLALATTLAILVTSFILLIMAMRLGHLNAFDILLITLLWGLYLTAVLCIYFQSYAGVSVSIITMFVLLLEIWMAQRQASLNNELDIEEYEIA